MKVVAIETLIQNDFDQPLIIDDFWFQNGGIPYVAELISFYLRGSKLFSMREVTLTGFSSHIQSVVIIHPGFMES